MERLTNLSAIVLWLVASLAAAATAFAARPQTIPSNEAVGWTRHLVPLPKQVEITAKLTLPVQEVAVVAPTDAAPLIAQARKELLASLSQAEGAQPGDDPSFTIVLRVGGPEAAALQQFKNADQAYNIRPETNDSGLRLVALTPHGLYYAGKTLQQLIRARAKAGTVEMPVLKVTDWPDMEDRGLWGGDSYEHLRWMSDRKMNIDEQISATGVDEEKRCYVRLGGEKQRMIDEGPTYGINPIPVVLHLEQLSNYGIFKAHPELQGKDARPGAICYSNPLFVDILAQWLVLWGNEPAVREVDVWMAENLKGKSCQCEQCRKEDRDVLEARAIVTAWEKARKQHPNLGLRILTSEETEDSNVDVFRQLPPEVKVWYYHSLYTYNTTEQPMIRPYLVDTIKQGRWVGVCPNLCAVVPWHLWEPLTGAHFIHYRMNEFVDKNLSGLIGYGTPTIYHTAFNVEAAAEWAWNAKGRSPHEFALSWAMRQGMKDPEKFAAWSDTLGPVAWDVYGSDWPTYERRNLPGKAADLLKQGKLPELGEHLYGRAFPWGDFKSVEQLNRDVTQAERAVNLAREMGDETILQESLVIQGYINSLKALWELKHLVGPVGVAEKNKADARHNFAMYLDGLEQARTALSAWEASLPGELRYRDFTVDTVELVQGMITGMRALASDLGCLSE